MSKERKTFKNCFFYLMDSRLNQIFSEIINQDQVYNEHSERIIELHDAIAQLLGPEKKLLIDEYENANIYCTEVHQDNAYIIGFRDGMELQRLLNENN